MGFTRGFYLAMITLIVFIVAVSGGRRSRWSRRNRHRIVSLNNLGNQMSNYNEELPNRISRERSTLNEVPEYANDSPLQQSGLKQMSRYEEAATLRYMELANQNIRNVLKFGKCKEPTPRCLHMNKMNGYEHKSYWPSCALVHKCSHDSGCCHFPGHVCSPAKAQTIKLFFFSMTPQSHPHREARAKVDMFTFENHTECECRPASRSFSQNLNEEYSRKSERACQCPKHFIVDKKSEKCQCTCNESISDKQLRKCRRILKGKRSYDEKGCTDECGPPRCDYGDYIRDLGRCIRKQEQRHRRRK